MVGNGDAGNPGLGLAILPPHRRVPEIVTDGPCLSGTLENLSDRFSPSAIDKARVQATRLLEDVVANFEKHVAAGEVGAKGTAKASSAAPLAGQSPTGLLYGRVQSGKTNAMLLFSGLAIDNGFRVIVVLTTNFVKLVQQTAERFQALQGVLLKDSNSIGAWAAEASHIERHIGRHGVVFICAKNPLHLGTLVGFLDRIGAAGYPAVILDDEADQATPDTTTAARSSGRPNAPKHGSTISRLTVRNDSESEIGRSVRERLKHNVFLQVTATPYALLLQSSGEPFRPSFTRLLEPGDEYTGGEAFFSAEKVEEAQPPLVFVREEESEELKSASDHAPIGLEQAISFFLVSASALFLANRKLQVQNLLCHTSPKTVEHQRVADLIRAYLALVEKEIDAPEHRGVTASRFAWAYQELAKTLPKLPSLSEIVASLKSRLHLRRVLEVNSASEDVTFGRCMNFVVGGNILGRGLTIENLLVTYYLRQAKISQMDTVLQHARMFGYRASLMPYTRVFLPQSLADRFYEIHSAEQSLRDYVSRVSDQGSIPVRAPQGLRPTRANVLDTGSLAGFTPGQQVYPILQRPFRLDDFAAPTEAIATRLATAFGGTTRRSVFQPAPIETIVELVGLLPFESSGSWDPEAIIAVLKSIAADFGNQGFIRIRDLKATKRTYGTGAASGAELTEGKGKDKPVLMLFWNTVEGAPFWYPTIVFPPSMPAQVFNLD